MNYARRIVGNTAIVLTIKVVGVFSVLLTNATLARMLTQEEFGVYFLCVSVVMFFVILARFGQRQAIVRLVSEAIATGSDYKIISITISAMKISLLGSLLILLLGLFRIDVYLANILQTNVIVELSLLLFIWVFLLALETPSVEVLRGIDKIGYASIFDGVLSQILLAFCLILLVMSNISISLRQAVEISVIVVSISIVVAALVLYFNLKDYTYKKNSYVLNLLSISMPLLLVNLTVYILNNSGIWLSGIFLNQQSVALYGAAWKFVSVLLFPLMIANLAIQPIVVHLNTTKKIKTLEKVLRGTATLLAIPALLASVILITFREELLILLYGDDYIDSAQVFLILTIGQLVNVLTGQSSIVLGLCGHQNALMYVSIISGIIGIALSSILVNSYGIIGIAIGVSIGLALSNIISLYLVHRYIGIKIYASINPVFVKEAIDRLKSK
ncbi:MAG: oligosaccharide flippase family protein [Candidatus Thiodiazotropha sp. (ex Codakia rugifera)]|nr:oligosaccharide flippase family protein [Candidatus Thiodiazotropha sp. (ex Codakia rugifera)]